MKIGNKLTKQFRKQFESLLPSFKRFHVIDDFDNAVMPTVMHWFFEGEFIELRKMQGLKYQHKKED
jgi:hypothetical protein